MHIIFHLLWKSIYLIPYIISNEEMAFSPEDVDNVKLKAFDQWCSIKSSIH